MFDGRFDQHFAEIFAASLADKGQEQPYRRETILFAAMLGVIAVICMVTIA